MMVHLSASEVLAVGVVKGSTNWGVSLMPLLKSKGFPMKKVFVGSLGITWMFDNSGGVYFADSPGGGMLRKPTDADIQKWLKKYDNLHVEELDKQEN